MVSNGLTVPKTLALVTLAGLAVTNLYQPVFCADLTAVPASQIEPAELIPLRSGVSRSNSAGCDSADSSSTEVDSRDQQATDSAFSRVAHDAGTGGSSSVSTAQPEEQIKEALPGQASAVSSVSGQRQPSFQGDQVEPLAAETPRKEAEQLEIKVRSRLQAQSKFNKTYPPDAPYALVAIRFPAEYSPNFIRNMGRLSMFRRDTLATARSYVNEQVLKSAYYATELYSYMEARLPEDSVILEPCKLAFSTDGKVIANPIRKAVPAVVTVDLFCALSAERVRGSGHAEKGHDTFADYVDMFANITKQTKDGAVAVAGLPVFDAEQGWFGLTVDRFYNSTGDRHEFKLLERVGKLSVTDKPAEAGGKFVSLEPSYRCPLKAVTETERLIDGEGAVPCLELWRRYYQVIEAALESEKLTALEPYLVASFVDEFDPEMAELLHRGVLAGRTTGATRRKLELLSRYMENERRKIFALEAQRIEETLYSSELGDSVRSMATSELEYLRRKQSSKRRQYAAGLVGVAAGAGSLAAAVSMPTPAFSNLLTTVSFASVGMLQNEGRLQQKLSDTFQQLERLSTEAQTTFMLQFGNEALEVSGTNIDDLRARFKDKYQAQFEAYTPARGADL